jgi:hypothetical protein
LEILYEQETSFVSVFSFVLHDSQLVFNETQFRSILSTLWKLNVQFYNPKSSEWEPIIEDFGFNFDLSLNSTSTPHKYLILELNPDEKCLNINIAS